MLLCVLLARLKSMRVWRKDGLLHFGYRLHKSWTADCILFEPIIDLGFDAHWGFLTGIPGEKLQWVLRRWGKDYGER